MSPGDDVDGGLPSDGTAVVVGASLAGLRAAETLRSEGFEGRLHLVGDELHLPYDRPPLSKQVLAGTWPPERVMLADRARLDGLRIELAAGQPAVALDPVDCRVTLADGSVLDADGVVVATGASPRRLPGTEEGDTVTVLRTLDDATALRRRVLAQGPGCRVVVVGAGFIGSEVASTCAGLDCRVTVLEAMPTPLAPAVGEAIGAALATLHAAAGVTLRTEVGVTAVHPPGAPADGRSGGEPPPGAAGWVELTTGEWLAADIVVAGIGVRPNTDWLVGSGLELADGVVCDDRLFAAGRVTAAGDVARWRWRHDGLDEPVRIEHWQVAAEMGVAAARSLLAGRSRAPAFDPVPYFWSDQYGVRIQVLGRPDPTDDVAFVDGSPDEGRYVALYGRAGRLRAALAVGRPRKLMAFRPLLAAGASWAEATSLPLD
ncbi:MAG: NAD(P)/FAD-dependent oxidoreductase [Acidimicrobiales bacterium]